MSSCNDHMKHVFLSKYNNTLFYYTCTFTCSYYILNYVLNYVNIFLLLFLKFIFLYENTKN